MSSKLNDPRPYEQYLLTLALLLISGLLIYVQAAKRLDLLAYDIAINVAPAPIDQNTVIIAIDEKSLNGIGQWPWRRGVHAQLIDKLTEYNAALIAFDIIFSERGAEYPEDDLVFARSIKNNGHIILPLHINPLSHGNTLSEILPIPELVKVSQALGHVHVDVDEDGLARGLYLNSGIGDAFWPSISMAMASEINPMIKYIREVDNLKTAPYMSVKTQYRLIPFAGPGGTFPTYSYIDVMLDQIPADTFRDKTVLIGASASGLGDVIPTPVSKSSSPMSGVELHANAYSALMTNTTIQPVSATWGYLLTFAFIMIPILIFPRLKPTYVMPSTILLVCLVVSFSYLLIAYDHTWFPPINSVIGILIAYPLWSWQRMRHLNSFLNHELSNLTTQQNIDVRKLDQHPIEKVFLSLTAILKPQHYLLIKNNLTLHSFEKEKLTQTKTKVLGKWQHSEYESWIKLKQGRDTFKLGFSWEISDKTQSIRASTIEFLDKLNLLSPPDRKNRRYYERIAGRIAQVRTAINSMQDMRAFITKGFEEMPGAVMVTNPVGIIVFCNSKALAWLNKTEQDLIGKPIHSLFDPTIHGAIIEHIGQALISGEQSNDEIQHNDRDLLIHCVPFLVDIDSDAGLMITLSDITKIRQQQREKNQLIDFLSHDVRSPLVSQLAMLHGLKTGRIEWDKKLIPDIEQHAKRSLNLSDQFLQITRAEQTAEQEFYEFDFTNTIENSIDAQSHFAHSKQINIIFDDADPVWILGNAELMERMITNLLSNAIKYSPTETTISITSTLSKGHARLIISDQGFGIDQHELPYIFNRFRRQRHSEVNGEKGAGLGLNFVKVVVEKHKGTITIDSKVGEGTSFTIEFPALEVQD
jgi:CHASE2 domain-containing sensor protein/signal transduction histidine kinase